MCNRVQSSYSGTGIIERFSIIINQAMIVRQIYAKSILSKSRVFDYTINPYVGCQHGCTYCYARFMKRTTGHTEPWGEFVDVKINAPELLRKEIDRKTPGRVWISGVCDPYQPIEARYDWPITIQTKSALVLRDIELLRKADNIEVGFTVTTGDESIRRLFEPNAPSIKERIKALNELHLAGVRTFAMIAPMLPEAEQLVSMLAGKVDSILIDRMNYHYSDWVYRRYKLEGAMADDFFYRKGKELAAAFEKQDIDCQVVF
jgi:DNA repair photolyase